MAREIATEALAIAHKSQSKIAESRALVNLSDIQLRRQRDNGGTGAWR